MVLGIINVAFGFRFAVAGQNNLFYVPLLIAMVILMGVAFGAKTFLAKRRQNKNVPFGGPMPAAVPPFAGVPSPAYEANRPYAGGYDDTRGDIQLGNMGDPPSYSQQPQKPTTFL